MSTPAHQRIDGIDFWRGFVLLTIFVNHAPQNVVAYITHHNFGFSDGAEAFVFLSGMSVALAYGRRFMEGQIGRSIRAIFRRLLTLYWVQMAVAILGMLFLIAAAHVVDSDDLTDDDDRQAVLDDPVRTVIGMFGLTHQLGFFNILPLYIVLLFGTPALLALARIDRRLMLAASGALYLLTRHFSLALPNWPLDLGWFFNPLAWQLIFCIGLFFGLGLKKDKLPYDRVLFIVCLLYLAGSLLLITDLFGFVPDLWDNVRAHVAHDKNSLAWVRLVHFLAITYAIYYSGLTGLLRTTKVYEPLALMGRHSLPVFATGAFLTLVGEAIMETGIEDFAGQFIIVVGGTIIQYWVARYFEARALAKAKAANVAEPTLAEPTPAPAPASVEPSLQPQQSATRVAV